MPRKKIPQKVIEASRKAAGFRPRILDPTGHRPAKHGNSRMMYLENKSSGLSGGEARIGRVTFSKTGATLYYYQGKAFQSRQRTGI